MALRALIVYVVHFFVMTGATGVTAGLTTGVTTGLTTGVSTLALVQSLHLSCVPIVMVVSEAGAAFTGTLLTGSGRGPSPAGVNLRPPLTVMVLLFYSALLLANWALRAS